jgi:hypothetical protein
VSVGGHVAGSGRRLERPLLRATARALLAVALAFLRCTFAP